MPSPGQLRPLLLSFGTAAIGAVGVGVGWTLFGPGPLGLALGGVIGVLVGGGLGWLFERRPPPSEESAASPPVTSGPSNPSNDERPSAATEVRAEVDSSRPLAHNPRDAGAGPREAVYTPALQPLLRQSSLAFEQLGSWLATSVEPPAQPNAGSAADAAGRIDGARLLASLGHGAATRAQEVLERLEGEASGTAPFPVREDLASFGRALGFELGAEIALRCPSSVPAQAVGDRSLLRLALTVLAHCATAELDLEGRELLVEADLLDQASSHGMLRVLVDACPRGLAQPPPQPCEPRPDEPALMVLGRLMAAAGGRVLASDDRRRVGLELPVGRFRRMTATTLYGLGALSTRRALVIAAGPLARVCLCDLLGSWRIEAMAVGTVPEALEALAEAARAGLPFDLSLVALPQSEPSQVLAELASAEAHFGRTRLVTLEPLESLLAPLPPPLAARRAVRLPRPPAPSELLAALTELVAPRPNAPVTHRSSASGLNVLVAEDNPVNQALVKKLLERRGHTVVIAENGADLLDRLSENPDDFDAALIDIQMPIMDGYEAAAVIRLREAQSGRRRLPLIAVTAHALGGERERCLDAGMDAYLAKPIVDRELFEILDATAPHAPVVGPEPAPTSGVFDLTRIREFAGADQDFLRSIVELLAATAPRLVEEIDAAVSAGDAAAVYRAAHQLKGSVGNFGAREAQAAALALETLGHQGALAGAPAELTRLRAAMDELFAALRALLERG